VLTVYVRLVAVGADCKVGTSGNAGASWSWTAPDSGGGFFGLGYDVARNLFACGNDGVFEWAAGTKGWKQILSFTSPTWTFGVPFGTPSRCHLITSRDDDNHLFVSALWSAYFPRGPMAGPLSGVFEVFRDGAGVWQVVDLRGGGHANGRDVFLETRPTPLGLGYDLFWHSTDLTYFVRCKRNPNRQECPVGTTGQEAPPPQANPPWVVLGHNPGDLHADDTRIVFEESSPYCVRFISSDGGIQRPTPGDCDGTGAWKYTDVGIRATEIYDFAMTDVTSSGNRPGLDLSIATQDNGGYAELAGTSEWQRRSDSDGIGIEATPTVSAAAVSTIHTYFKKSPGGDLIGGRGLDGLTTNSSAPFQPPFAGLRNGEPAHQLVTARGRYVLAVEPTAGSQAALFTSGDGVSWTRVITSGGTLAGFTNGLGGAAIEVANRPVQRLFIRARGRLWRINDVNKFGSPVGLNPKWAFGPYGVGDANHLLAFACDASTPNSCGYAQVIASDNGGLTWRLLPLVTRMATTDTKGNRYRLILDPASGPIFQQISSVGMSPVNPKLMVVGTQDVGLLASGDGGSSWQRMTTGPSLIQDIQFDSSGVPYLATFGSGMYAYPGIAPRRMSLTVGVDRNGRTIWQATVRTTTAKPVSGVTVQFSVVSESGIATRAGSATTNLSGRATIAVKAPARPHTVHAKAFGRGILDLEAEMPVT